MAETFGGWCVDEKIIYADNNGKSYCIFHAPTGEKRVTLDEFNEIVIRKIKESDRSKRVLLEGTIFDGDISFSHDFALEPFPEVSFFEAEFVGDVNFLGVVFEGEALFGMTKFHKEVWFSNAEFKKRAFFERVSIYGEAQFEGVKFHGSSEFDYAKFYSNVNFIGARFSGSSSFERAYFKNEAHFIGASFKKSADFVWCLFDGDVRFSDATFEGMLQMMLARFNERTDLSANFLGEWEMTEVTIMGEFRMESCDLTEASFQDTRIDKIEFVNCSWLTKGSRKVLFDELILTRVWSSGLKGVWERVRNYFYPSPGQLKKVQSLYRLLKQKNIGERNWPEVSCWHYGEKEMYRRGSLLRRFFPLSFSNLYWISSGYGERPVRAFCTLLIILFGTSLLMAVFGLQPKGNVYGLELVSEVADVDSLREAGSILLNTVQHVSFQKSTLYKPFTLWGELVKVVAQILVPIQVALFIFAIRNRFRR